MRVSKRSTLLGYCKYAFTTLNDWSLYKSNNASVTFDVTIKAYLNLAFRQALLILAVTIALINSGQAQAQSVHLSLCIDASGSVGSSGFDSQIQGTADSIRAIVPTDGTVELSVVIFGNVATPLSFTETDNGNTITNSIVVNSASDIEDIATEIENVTYPSPGEGTNTQDCINEAMDLLGCGTVEGPFQACPEGIDQVIDISTDGDPTFTSLSTTMCVNNGSTIDPECQADAVAASDEARLRGVDVINVIGIGAGPTVANMQEWAFDAITTPPPAPRPAAHTIEVFDPDNSQPGNSYTVDIPALGDRGYVVILPNFSQYESTISAKIFNELNIDSDLSVVKTADQVSVPSGGTLTYTLAITGSASKAVPNVVVTDTLPPGVTFVSADDDPSTANVVCAELSGIVTCDIASLPSGVTTNIEVVVTVD